MGFRTRINFKTLAGALLPLTCGLFVIRAGAEEDSAKQRSKTQLMKPKPPSKKSGIKQSQKLNRHLRMLKRAPKTLSLHRAECQKNRQRSKVR